VVIEMVGKEFEYLEEHTADVAFIAYGKDLNEVFQNAAKAMFNVMTDISRIEKKEKRTIKVVDDELKGLLKNWLQELIVLFDVDGIAFSEFKVNIEKKNDKWVLEGEAYGELFDPNKHTSGLEVKAIPYHWMEIGEKNGLKYARVLLDI